MNRRMLWAAVVLFLTTVAVVAGAKRKYAPTYCLRLKFNCEKLSAQKRKHVCCMFPLPVSGNAQPAVTVVPQQPNTGDDGKVGVKRIRPLRLPSRASAGSGENGEIGSGSDSSGNDGGKQRYDVFNQKKRKAKEPKADKKDAAAAAAINQQDQKASGSNRVATITSINNIPTKDGVNVGQLPIAIGSKRPRICQRLVVNCRSNPSHRCCAYSVPTTTPPSLSPVVSNDLQTTKAPLPSTTSVRTSPEPPSVILVEVTPGLPKKKEVQTRPIPTPTIVASVETVPLDRHEPSVADQEQHHRDDFAQIPELELSRREKVVVPEKVTDEPYERIPAECFTMVFDCNTSPGHMCCPYHQQ